jgi:uncharacterized protein YlxW (UPF0749 family)
MATPVGYTQSIRQIEYAADRERERKDARQQISNLQKTLNTLKERIIELENN